MAKNINSWILFDVETGGFSPQKNAVTEISMVAIKGDTMEKIDLLSTFIKPYGNFTYEEEALKFTGITYNDIEGGMDVKEVVNEIIALLTKADFTPRNKGSKPILVAYNSAFDKGFLIQLFDYCGKMKELEKLTYGTTDYYGHYQPEMLDAIHLTKAAFGNDPDIPNFKLGTCVEKAGIDLSDAHSSLQDTLAMRDMVVGFISKLRSNSSEEKETVTGNRIRNHFQF